MFSRRDLTRLIVPLIIEQILTAAIGLVDTLMVSNAGEAVVSGVSIVDTVNQLVLSLLAALATGGAIISAQYLGREDDRSANKAARQLLYATTVLSAGVMLFCLAGQGPIIDFMFGKAEAAVVSSARIYFIITAMSFPFTGIYNACAALFRNMGNAKVPMLAAAVMNVLNVILNAILIYGFDMGAGGAAIASLISRMVCAGILFWLMQNPHQRIHLRELFPVKMDWGMVRSILKIGVPNGLENSVFQIGKMLVQSFVIQLGTASIAAAAVANSVSALTMLPGSAIGLAMMTVVGQCIGARDAKQARHYMWRMTMLAQILVSALNILIIFFIPNIVGLYGLKSDTIALAEQLVLAGSISGALFWTLSFTLPNGLRAANDVKFTMVVSILSMWTFRAGFGYLLGIPLGLGVVGIWIGMGTDWAFRCAVFVWRFFSGKWKNRQII